MKTKTELGRRQNWDEDKDGTAIKASEIPLRFDHRDGDLEYGQHEYREGRSRFPSFFLEHEDREDRDGD